MALGLGWLLKKDLLDLARGCLCALLTAHEWRVGRHDRGGRDEFRHHRGRGTTAWEDGDGWTAGLVTPHSVTEVRL